MTTQLSAHFTLEELTFSDTAARLGIDNKPGQDLIEHAEKYLIPGIESVRDLIGLPLHINSGYRSPALNAAVPGSSDTSQHTKFEAADIICPQFGNPLTIIKAVITSKKIKWDQIIYEYGAWMHISFSAAPRGILTSKFTGKPYQSGIWTEDGKRIF